MPSTSHVYADLSAGFIHFRTSDGTHTHIQRVHVGTATIDNTTDPGSPTDFSNLINPETELNATARNYCAAWSQLAPSTYAISVLDFQPVVGGVPLGPVQALQPYTLNGTRSSTGIPEAELSLTFRDGEGAPVRFTIFGSSDIWLPASKPVLAPNWAGGNPDVFAAYIVGLVKASGPAYPANMTNIVSHHGSRVAVGLARVSGLNNRLRRAYRVK